ncbi:Fur-regulated basic protein FbpA [Heyndrickxia oleronia]|uniref:Fur-regulated basic protein FbpA n=1 Tax=Heyndrickxia oleronia TaxID=38875 RepID=UPI003F836EB0
MTVEKELKKRDIIDQLLNKGIYKSNNKQLYELSLYDLKSIYNEIIVGKSS